MVDGPLLDSVHQTLSNWAGITVSKKNLRPIYPEHTLRHGQHYVFRAPKQRFFIKVSIDDGRDLSRLPEHFLHADLRKKGFVHTVPCLFSQGLQSDVSCMINAYPFVNTSGCKAPSHAELGELFARFHNASSCLIKDEGNTDDLVFLHGDLRANNIMPSVYGPLLIDFEFARVGHRLTDLASLPFFRHSETTIVEAIPSSDLENMIAAYTTAAKKLPNLKHRPVYSVGEVYDAALNLHNFIAEQVACVAPERARSLSAMISQKSKPDAKQKYFQ